MPPLQKDVGDGVVAHEACSSTSIVSGDRRFWFFLPAAGNSWNSDLNNVGSNGNYWSAELNSGNSNNARNLNFNSGNWNADNNNNRYNGFSVRPVCPSAALPSGLALCV